MNNILDPITVKNSTLIHIIYSINGLFNSFGILMNVGLIIITVKNKTLQSTCHLLIAYCSLCTILLLSAEFIPLIVVLSTSLGSISMLTCFIIHLLPAYGICSVTNLIVCIGLDRALSVFFPFWYNYRNERKALLSLIALSSLFPLYVNWLILQNTLENPSRRIVCTFGELLSARTVHVAFLAFCLIFVSILCYLMVWVKLKWDMRKSSFNGSLFSLYVDRKLVPSLRQEEWDLLLFRLPH
uniref:G-protein coupled receptors family 1 profile domain-containing protein n=2 Tax=Meloidogyne TaxID=189290 RepID=A0A6V7UAH0_MELEN|nr:unnamed protein product [Meloidogyne enterolobii]